MTHGEIDAIILKNNPAKCIHYFASMTENQRKKLAPRALQWLSALNGCAHDGVNSWLLDKAAQKDVAFYQQVKQGKVDLPKELDTRCLESARLAVLSSCSFQELKKLGMTALPSVDQCFEILTTRKPAWLDNWCAHILKIAPATHWFVLYKLEKEGLCKIERDTAYFTSMVQGLPPLPEMQEILSNDEHLRNNIWSMLADPTVMRHLTEPEQISHEIFRRAWNSGSASIFGNASQQATRSGTDIWIETLLALAENGKLDRERLTAFSFQALSQCAEREAKRSYYQQVSTADFAIRINRGLVKSNARHYVNHYSALLSATHKDVSIFASNTLLELPADALNASDICSTITAAFLGKAKEPAELALKLLSKLAASSTDSKVEIGNAIICAFSHPSKDIHKKALTILGDSRLLAEAEVRREFRQRIDMLSGLERKQADALLAKMGAQEDEIDNGEGTGAGAGAGFAAPSSGAGAGFAAPSSGHGSAASAALGHTQHSAIDLSQLTARAANIDRKFRSLAQIDECIEALNTGVPLMTPVNLDSMNIPRLDPLNAIRPIDKVDDLIYAMMKILNGQCEPIEIELVLDAVSRLGNERDDNFTEKTDALRQKVSAANTQWMFGWVSCISCIAAVWTGQVEELNPSRQLGLFVKRCLGVAGRLAKKQSMPLLAAPTHKGGWIDPQVIVDRWMAYREAGIDPDIADVVTALLRLAPERRSAALNRAQTITGEMGDALRSALGADQFGPINTPELWVAAYRAREPLGTSNQLLARLPDFGPDGPSKAEYGFDPAELIDFANARFRLIAHQMPNFLPVPSNDPEFISNRASTSRLQTAEDVQRRFKAVARYDLYPTVQLHDNSNTWGGAANISLAWLHNRESLLAMHAKRFAQNIDSVGSYWHGDIEFVFDPDVPMAGNGRYFIAMALSSKNPEVARLALDALIAAVGECRIEATTFGEALASILPTGVITAVRWTRALRDMSKVSPLHAYFTWLTIDSLLTHATLSAIQPIPFLEILAELQSEHEFALSEELKTKLTTVSGTSKTAKLAKSLQNSRPAGKSNSLRRAALAGLESRIARAERWHDWLQGTGKEAVAAALS
ncbi:MAG TPA: DUF6493 family protein [Candidatus Obscuribacterales bacterium]